MNRLAVPFLAVLSFSLLHCAGDAEMESNDDPNVTVVADSTPDALAGVTTTGAAPAAGTTAEKDSDKTNKKGKEPTEYYVVKMEDLLVSGVQ